MNKIIFKILIVCMIINFSCSENKNSEEELLRIYFDDQLKESELDSIFLSLDNTNEEIYNRYSRLLRKNIDLDPNLEGIFSKEQDKNYKSQVIKDNKWDLDLSTFKNVFSSELTNKIENVLYVAKPIYTIDRKYALLYSFKKGAKGVYFLPPIEVYNFNGKVWVKTTTLRETGFN
ncbi:MAG: hypothetical protein KDC90_07930 [Ignavibacteriae bacterium]|nr:hypothetical protein [Ignavibacteriota bacterium]